MRNIFADKT